MMKILIETYRLLRKMGLYKAYSTLELVSLKGNQRCSVLKQLHRLENAGYLEKKINDNVEFYWKVKSYPEKPEAQKRWKGY